MLITLGMLLIGVNALLCHFVGWRPLKPVIKTAEEHLYDGQSPFCMWAYDVVFFVIYVGIAIASGYGWYFVLRYLGETSAATIAGALFTLQPDPIIWVVIAMCMAMTTAMIPLVAMAQFLLGTRYQEYMNASYKRSRRGQIPLLPWLFGLITLIALTLFVFASDWYASFGPTHMVFNRFWGFGERSYAYNQIVEVANVHNVVAPNGNVRPRDHVAVRFDDGVYWRSIDGNRSKDALRDETIRKIVLEKTGLSATEYDVLPW